MLRQVPLVQGALVSMDPVTSRVLAMSGGWNFESSQFNRATQAQRQPGSSFKPMVYLTAMEQGLSPSQKVLDGPFELDQGAAGVWRPGNYEKSYAGPISLHQALERSLNLVTVRLAQKVGMDAVAANAIAFHVVDQMTHFLPNALGAVETTVLRQAGAYASLNQNGREVVPSVIDSVQDRDGHVIWRAPGTSLRGLRQPGAAAAADRRAPADRRCAERVPDRDDDAGRGAARHRLRGRQGAWPAAIAGKTGTTQDFNDAWFVGFTPDLVTAVWMGFDTPSSLGNGETGGTVVAPIWHDFMAVALKDRPNLPFRVPDGVTVATWGAQPGGRVQAGPGARAERPHDRRRRRPARRRRRDRQHGRHRHGCR